MGEEEIPISETPLWENLGTYLQESCYEVFPIYHDLMYESSDS